MATPLIFITLLTATYLRQQYKGNAFLYFHGNNGYSKGPQVYLVRTLPTFLLYVSCNSYNKCELILQITLIG